MCSIFHLTYGENASTPEITCWGDSLTQNGIAVALSKLYLGERQVNNQGVGGEPSTAISVRQGGTPVLVTFSNNLIPADGVCTVQSNTVNGDPKIRHAIKGSINGVPGILSRNIGTGIYTWTRTQAGSGTPCDPNTIFTVNTNHAETDTAVLWFGRNNVNTDQTAEYVKNDLKRSIDHLQSSPKRFVVLGITRSDYPVEYIGGRRANRINDLNNWIKTQWPTNYIETMDLLLAAHDPINAQDAVDVRNGVIPSSLRKIPDKTHLNSKGDMIIASEIKKFITMKKW
jgi:lysophospholipase L1-like esterase